MSRLYMMAAITSRSARKKFREFYKTHEQQVFFEILGKGTANSEVLNYFGLEETEKILFLSIVTGDTWKRLKRGLIIDMKIDVPGTGIAFAVPLASIGGKKTLQYLMGHSDVSVTLNIYTHTGYDDAKKELARLKEARDELEKKKFITQKHAQTTHVSLIS